MRVIEINKKEYNFSLNMSAIRYIMEDLGQSNIDELFKTVNGIFNSTIADDKGAALIPKTASIVGYRCIQGACFENGEKCFFNSADHFGAQIKTAKEMGIILGHFCAEYVGFYIENGEPSTVGELEGVTNPL